MNRIVLVLSCLVILTTISSAQAAENPVVDATACDILQHPQSFDGKMVRIKATASASFEEFVVRAPGCNSALDAIWLSYPEGTKAKAGPTVLLQLQPAKNFAGAVESTPARKPVTLDKSKDFQQFDALLATPYKSRGMCLGCNRYTVTATLVGRLDAVADANLKRGADGKIIGTGGFGNLNAYAARLVLASVAEVASQEVDYKSAAAASKDDAASSSGGDPVANAHKAAQAFGAGNPAGERIERAAAAYGKQGEDNGVMVSFGVANEAKQESKSDKTSPDGLLYNCTFDMDHLKGDALSRAMVHVGQHIADLRKPPASSTAPDVYDLESQAWVTAVYAGLANQQKTLTLPGGFLLWNMAWSAEERNSKVQDVLSNYLVKEEQLKKY